MVFNISFVSSTEKNYSYTCTRLSKATRYSELIKRSGSKVACDRSTFSFCDWYFEATHVHFLFLAVGGRCLIFLFFAVLQFVLFDIFWANRKSLPGNIFGFGCSSIDFRKVEDPCGGLLVVWAVFVWTVFFLDHLDWLIDDRHIHYARELSTEYCFDE